MAEEAFSGECCSDMIELKQWRIEHDKKHITIDQVLDKLLNRLPLWATILFTASGGVIGSLLTIIIFLLGELSKGHQ